MNEALYVLCESMIAHQLVHKGDGKSYVCKQIMDFSHHKMDEILSDDWSRAHISDKAIVYKDIVYMTNSDGAD